MEMKVMMNLPVIKTLLLICFALLLHCKATLAVTQCYQCDYSFSNEDCQRRGRIQQCPNNGKEYSCETLVVVDWFGRTLVRKECSVTQQCLLEQEYLVPFCRKDRPHKIKSICQYCCNNTDLCNPDYTYHDLQHLAIPSDPSGPQNVSVCKEEGSTFALDCPVNKWILMTQSFYGKKVRPTKQECAHEPTDYILNAPTYVDTCLGKNRCTLNLDWQSFEDNLPVDTVLDGNSYFQMSVTCLGRILSVSEVPAESIITASNISLLHSLLQYYHFYMCDDDTNYTAVELDCPTNNVLNLFTYQYGKIRTAIENRCFYTLDDNNTDGVLNLLDSAKSACNGKQRCVNLFEWSNLEKLFSDDIYNGRFYIDIIYLCTPT